MFDKVIPFSQAIKDKQLLGGVIKDVSTMAAWVTFGKATWGEPLEDSELALYQHHTGRQVAPTGPVDESYVKVGRGGGKTHFLALDAAYRMAFIDHRASLAPGEWAVIEAICPDRKQARIFMGYLEAIFELPLLRKRVVRKNSEMIELDTRIRAEVHTASFRTTRGYSLAGLYIDEGAFLRDENYANPFVEIVRAGRPGLARIAQSALRAASTPYAKEGHFWEMNLKHWGRDNSPVLIWAGTSLEMNPTLNRKRIEAALLDDPEAGQAEWLGEFRDDLSSFISGEVMDKCIIRGRIMSLPFQPGVEYCGFVDASGGAGRDEFCLGIGHSENGKVIIDVLVASNDRDVYGIAASYAELVKSYRVQRIYGDRFAAQWVAQSFQKAGVEYSPSEWTKSELYLESLAALSSGMVELPDDPVTERQFKSLMRKTNPSGKDSIDHPPGGRDDRANTVCGVVAYLKKLETAPVAWELPYQMESGGRSAGIGEGRKGEVTPEPGEHCQLPFIHPLDRKKELWDRPLYFQDD